MEIYSKSRPEVKENTDGRKVRYKDQDAIDAKYKDVKRCRYRCGKCYDSSHYGKCCHTCALEDTCKWACLSTLEDCQSVF